MGVMEGTNNPDRVKRERAGSGKGRKRVRWLLFCAAGGVFIYLVLVSMMRLDFLGGEIGKDWHVLKAEIDTLDALVDTTVYPRGMSVDDVLAVSSAESQATTERLGAGRNVYVLATDPKLRYLLANYHDIRYEQYPAHKPDDLSNFNYWFVNNPVGRAILGVSEQQWGRAAVYLGMVDDYHSAAVEIYGQDAGRNVVFLRRNSTEKLLAGSKIPYATPLKQVDQWTLPHELAHSWDFELLERKYRRKVGGQVSVNEDEADLIAESIADLTTALVLLRETGNDDTLKYQLLPFRTRLASDYIHATEYLLARTYGAFTLGDVAGRTDHELSALAIAAVERAVVEDPQGLSDFLFERELRFGPEWLSKLPGLRSNTMADGRTALENSLNNLVYQGKTQEQCRLLVDAIRRQIKSLDDQELAGAWQQHPFSCDDQVKQADTLKGFATAAGFSIDWHSHERLAANLAKVDAYYQTLLAVPPSPQAE